MAWRDWFAKEEGKEIEEETVLNIKGATVEGGLAKIAGISDIVKETNVLRTTNSYDNDFDLFDDMLKLDPELNGAVRAISLSANSWEIDYSTGRNRKIRRAIQELVESLDFDDVLISSMRDLMVYGNSINKIVGRTGVGITDLQSLPIKQMSIVDERGRAYLESDGAHMIKPSVADEQNPIIDPLVYVLREQNFNQQSWSRDEIWHLRIDYRSNWFVDRMNRHSYGVWGASRFTSLKQAIRAKYNSLNNRIALEDSLTKQFITIGKDAVEHIQDPAEQQERLSHIVNQVGTLLEGLRADQVPILPHYVEMHHIDLNNTIPDNTAFMDSINADISAVMQVPRVAAGQERGSTFAASYNANIWSFQSIRRLQKVVVESVKSLFTKHLELLGVPHSTLDLPTFSFKPLMEEGAMEKTQRATLSYRDGVMNQNEARELLGLTPVDGGDEFSHDKTNSPTIPMPENNRLEDT
tara:strand:+ start:5820 stop:7220 length:1401 start_codon:yes stop_codon:yes gene_type:complete